MSDYTFAGFSSPNTTPVPDEFFDELAPHLTEPELRVCLYLLRRTFGFKKSADDISLSQLVKGIQKKDGTKLDLGTGLSKPSVIKGVRGLIAKGVVVAIHNSSQAKGNESTTYQLRFLGTPLVNAVYQGSKPALPALVNGVDTQETVVQEDRGVWENVLRKLQAQMTPANYQTWLSQTQPLGRQGATLVVGTPSAFVQEWLQSRFRLLVRKVLHDESSDLTDVIFKVSSKDDEQTA